jgi:hypothetical protein
MNAIFGVGREAFKTLTSDEQLVLLEGKSDDFFLNLAALYLAFELERTTPFYDFWVPEDRLRTIIADQLVSKDPNIRQVVERHVERWAFANLHGYLWFSLPVFRENILKTRLRYRAESWLTRDLTRWKAEWVEEYHRLRNVREQNDRAARMFV